MQTLNIILKFHRPEDQLPKTEGFYLTITRYPTGTRALNELHWSPKWQQFNTYDNSENTWPIKVEWWAERPQSFMSPR